jgi:SAM-dependent methyltransferase
MRTLPPSEETVRWYEANADDYAARTKGIDAAVLYEPFLSLLPPGGHILDAGCGSGRDALEFRRRGFAVTAFDASPRMAKLAGDLVGQPVQVVRYQDMAFDGRFDGVWACASLLHVPRAELDGVFVRFVRALKPGGVWYMSFKQGGGERVAEGRLFSDQTEESLGTLVRRHGLEVVQIWQSGDLRSDRAGQPWVNGVVRKAGRP